MGSARYGARIVTGVVTVGYTLLLLFTTGVATAGEDSYGSVKGTVTNAITGERLRKAYVRLAPVTDTAKVLRLSRMRKAGLASKTFSPEITLLEAEHQGLLDRKYGEDAGAPVEVRLAAGQNLSDLNIRLIPPAAISGRVRDEDGDPWTHAHIDVFRLSGRTANGAFRASIMRRLTTKVNFAPGIFRPAGTTCRRSPMRVGRGGIAPRPRPGCSRHGIRAHWIPRRQCRLSCCQARSLQARRFACGEAASIAFGARCRDCREFPSYRVRASGGRRGLGYGPCERGEAA